MSTEQKIHLDYAAARDDAAVVVVRGGKIILMVQRSEHGDDKFDRVVEALENQQSLASIEMIIAA